MIFTKKRLFSQFCKTTGKVIVLYNYGVLERKGVEWIHLAQVYGPVAGSCEQDFES
jgi:hypothetical protein